MLTQKALRLNRSGFTLVEVLIAITMMIVLITGVSQLFTTVIHNKETNDVQLRLKQAGLYAKETLDHLMTGARVIEDESPATLCDGQQRLNLTVRSPSGDPFTVHCENGDPGRIYIAGNQSRDLVRIADGFAIQNCVIMCTRSVTNWVQPYTIDFAFTIAHTNSDDARAFESQVVVRN